MVAICINCLYEHRTLMVIHNRVPNENMYSGGRDHPYYTCAIRINQAILVLTRMQYRLDSWMSMIHC